MGHRAAGYIHSADAATRTGASPHGAAGGARDILVGLQATGMVLQLGLQARHAVLQVGDGVAHGTAEDPMVLSDVFVRVYAERSAPPPPHRKWSGGPDLNPAPGPSPGPDPDPGHWP